MKKNKKITIVYCVDVLSCGGTEKQLALLIKGLDRSRFEPVLICLREFGEYFDRSELSCEIIELGIRKLFTLKSVIRLLKTVFRLRRNASKTIMHTFFQDSTYFGVLAGRLAGVRKVYSSRRDLGFWFKGKDAVIMKIINRLADGIIVNSQAIKQHVIDNEHYPADKIHVVYNAVDRSFSQEEIRGYRAQTLASWIHDPGSRIIGTVANYNRKVKRLDRFVDMAIELLKIRDDVKFMIVGDGSLMEEIRSQLAEIRVQKPESRDQNSENCHLSSDVRLQDFFLLPGQVSDPIPYICAFDVGINCSETEGFSNGVIECMACGVPVFASNNPGNVELVSHGETGFVVNSLPGAVEAISQLLNEGDLREKISSEGIRYVAEHFSAKRMIDEYGELYGRESA